MAWIPTVEIITPNGRKIKINEVDLKFYIGRGYALITDEKPAKKTCDTTRDTASDAGENLLAE